MCPASQWFCQFEGFCIDDTEPCNGQCNEHRRLCAEECILRMKSCPADCKPPNRLCSLNGNLAKQVELLSINAKYCFVNSNLEFLSVLSVKLRLVGIT